MGTGRGGLSPAVCTERGILRLLLGVTAVAFGVGVIFHRSLSPGVSFFCLLCLAVFGLSRLLARRRSVSSKEATPPAEEAQKDSALRILWATAHDFSSTGWGRMELDQLYLLVLNLRPGQALNTRLSNRLQQSVSVALSGVLDRLHDIARTARELELDDLASTDLERSIDALADELEHGRENGFHTVQFDPGRVGEAIETALSAVDRIREILRPHVVANLPAVTQGLLGLGFPGPLASRTLEFDATSTPSRLLVAVRPRDLSSALEDLIVRVFSKGCLAGPLRLKVLTISQPTVTLQLSWPLSRPILDHRPILEPLRLLSAYGVRSVFAAEPEERRAGIDILLPCFEELNTEVLDTFRTGAAS